MALLLLGETGLRERTMQCWIHTSVFKHELIFSTKLVELFSEDILDPGFAIAMPYLW